MFYLHNSFSRSKYLQLLIAPNSDWIRRYGSGAIGLGIQECLNQEEPFKLLLAGLLLYIDFKGFNKYIQFRNLKISLHLNDAHNFPHLKFAHQCRFFLFFCVVAFLFLNIQLFHRNS